MKSLPEHPLTAYRQRRSLSLDAFAALARTTKSTIWRIENGQQTPSVGLLHRLVQATGGEITGAELLIAHPNKGAA